MKIPGSMMMKDNIIWALRFIGGFGTLWVSVEFLRIFLILKHPRLRIITYKICLFFGIFGLLKLTGTVLDIWVFPGSITGALINNLMIFWLVGFMIKRRKRLQQIDEDTESRQRFTTAINEVLDEMRIARIQVHNAIS